MDSVWDTPFRVGCPIRRSRDQRSLASPPGFSQRATSFIASQCQGIHQMPLLALERHTQRQRPFSDIRMQISEIRTIEAANSPLRRHCRIPSTAPVFRKTGPHAVSRYGHTTRFFTIVHQQMPGPPPQGMHKACSGASYRVRAGTGCNRLSRFASQTTVGAHGRRSCPPIRRADWWR
jgi:hypothetical protein